MKKFAVIVGIGCLMIGSAHAKPPLVFHYACKGKGEDAHYYALTVNLLAVNPDRGFVKMQDQGPPFTHTTFRILKDDDDCAKSGSILSDNATFCYATQGDATLTWHGHEFECDQADTD
jgi:hypothetical protein